MWRSKVRARPARDTRVLPMHGARRTSRVQERGAFNELAEKVVRSVDPAGVTLFAGLRAEKLSEDPHARAYRLVTWLRELRGCLHINAVVAAGLTAMEAVLTAENGEFFAKLHGYAAPYPDVSHLKGRRDAAEETTAQLMADVYEKSLTSLSERNSPR